MLYLSLEGTEWPWVVLVCMQTVVLMPVEIAQHQKICRKLSRPTSTNYFGEILPDQVLIIFCRINYCG